jgi:hypothetical protein
MNRAANLEMRCAQILSLHSPAVHGSGRLKILEAKRLKSMDTRKRVTSLPTGKHFLFLAAFLLLLCAGFQNAGAAAHSPKRSAWKTPAKQEKQTQSLFSSPEEAMQAIVTAAKAKDRPALMKLFGSWADELLSGDEVEDTKDLADFSAAVEESVQLQKDDDAKYTLVVGKENWPLPIPIVKQESQWLFDTKAGLDEILNRRIGENELSAITTCRVYAVAQWEYYTEGDWEHDGVAEYAQKFISSPGQHNGLYWETAEGDKPSPFGNLVAEARTEGYPVGKRKAEGAEHKRSPFHGYYFKILKFQGAHAPGGKYGYIINGNMIAGYALVAYPDKWGNSGVMTFIINQQGRVYQKNLGPDTAKIAGAMTEYDPDPSWKLVEP